jgi:hypothetical protein
MAKVCAAAVIERFRPKWKLDSPPELSHEFKIGADFLLMFAL